MSWAVAGWQGAALLEGALLVVVDAVDRDGDAEFAAGDLLGGVEHQAQLGPQLARSARRCRRARRKRSQSRRRAGSSG